MATKKPRKGEPGEEVVAYGVLRPGSKDASVSIYPEASHVGAVARKIMDGDGPQDKETAFEMLEDAEARDKKEGVGRTYTGVGPGKWSGSSARSRVRYTRRRGQDPRPN
jgi:hypothetical protein